MDYGGDDSRRQLSYISPKFGGFQVGATYTPNADQDNHVIPNINDRRHDGMVGAVSYTTKVGDVGAAVGAGYSQMQGAGSADDLTEWLVAGRLDFGGGFRVAAAHQQTTGPDNLKGSVTAAGVRYTVGANAFSLVGSYGELENAGDMYSATKAAYRRTLGAGVFWDANLFVNRSENDAGEENSGSVVTTGLTVVF